ncbi:MAG: DNA topoisomerase I [Candidatus Methanomethylophilaceae archaeon]|jgi:DNA topoisomerase-1
MNKLIITEKANAARRISTILSDGKSSTRKLGGASVISFVADGSNYDVISLRGHILELDYPKEYNDWSASPPTELVYAPQVKNVKVKSILNNIKDLALGADEVIIATDYDREGELIGMETVEAAGVDISKVKRAKFSALTKAEVENAFSNLELPDKRLSNAAEARQIIDLSWGAVLTRQISLASGQVGKNFLSVGRVQSPTLKLLVDKNEEVESFVPVPFWNVNARFGLLAFQGNHVKNPFWEKEEAEAVESKIKDMKTGKVTSFEVTEKEEYRPPPFDTTQMQVEANKIGIPPTAAMKLAEELYISGYISYPRTENTEYPKSVNLRTVLEKLKASDFKGEVEEILKQEKILPSRGKRRTTDHPPIYPTAAATSGKMKGDKWKLYELIVRRFLATVAPVAKAEITECIIDMGGEEFKCEGYKQLFKGWKEYYGKYLKSKASTVPRMEIGEVVDVRSISMEESETKPPYRYNQGSLIQEMDRLQLGTKSTRHDIISKLYSRNYIQGNRMIPTAGGVALTKSLEKYGGGITEPDMTSRLEEDMQKISDGETTLEEVVSESQDMLFKVSSKIASNDKAIGDEIRTAMRSHQFIGKCTKCGNELTIKRSKNGNFIGCEGYPECTNAFPLPRGSLNQPTEEVCEKCGLPMLRVIRKGNLPLMQCVDPKCESNTERTFLGDCPTCAKGTIRLMYSKAGRRFAGCTEWPDCTQTYPLRPRGVVTPTGNRCEHCSAPVIVFGKSEECINPECPDKPKNRKKAAAEKKAEEKAEAEE